MKERRSKMKKHSNTTTTTEKLLASHPEWEVHTFLPINTPEEAGEYILTQDAYLDGFLESPYYTALALRVGEEVITADDVFPPYNDLIGELAYYRVFWNIIPEYANWDDASTHCDWAHPSHIEYIGTI
nr:MAG TPA: hypothetical protein [Caudoviricetes sp.]